MLQPSWVSFSFSVQNFQGIIKELMFLLYLMILGSPGVRFWWFVLHLLFGFFPLFSNCTSWPSTLSFPPWFLPFMSSLTLLSSPMFKRSACNYGYEVYFWERGRMVVVVSWSVLGKEKAVKTYNWTHTTTAAVLGRGRVIFPLSLHLYPLLMRWGVWVLV